MRNNLFSCNKPRNGKFSFFFASRSVEFVEMYGTFFRFEENLEFAEKLKKKHGEKFSTKC